MWQSYLTLTVSYGNSHYKIVAMETAVVSTVSTLFLRYYTRTVASGPHIRVPNLNKIGQELTILEN